MEDSLIAQLSRFVAAATQRRRLLAGLVGLGLSGLDDHALEGKRKKKKKRQPPSPPLGNGGDQAPACTADSCPLPPECSAPALETCVTALHRQFLLDIEPCRPACAGGDSTDCRACLEPIVAARQPDIQACITESCGAGAGAARAADQGVTGESDADWWVRLCDTPCCFRDRQACIQSFSRETAICVVGALVSCAVPIICAGLLLSCVTRAAYENSKCEGYYGCVNAQFGCRPDNTCCPANQAACGETCCAAGRICCNGKGCCSDADAHCCYMPDGAAYCCPSNRRCCSTGGPQCCAL